MTVREVKKEDIPRLAEIYNYYVLNTCVSFEEEAVTAEEFSKRVRRIKKSYPYLVAEENGVVIGYAYLDLFNPRTAYRITADLSIYFDKNYAGKGLGSEIYRAIEAAAEAQGIKNIISIITEGNGASVKFHEKQGFTVAGTLKNAGVKFGKTLSVTYMQKEM